MTDSPYRAIIEAAKICLKAEMERREKLKPGAPATTYTAARIAQVSAAIAAAEADNATIEEKLEAAFERGRAWERELDAS